MDEPISLSSVRIELEEHLKCSLLESILRFNENPETATHQQEGMYLVTTILTQSC
jgi:hypothetical protein